MVEMRNVSKTYETQDGPVEALAPFTLEIQRGEFVSVVGPSGCGKSTLLTLLSGLMPSSSGEILIDGMPLSGPYPRCGIAFQSPVLLEWRTALDNVLLQIEMRRLPIKSYRERAIALLASLGLEGATRRYPRELSGGMRQRVSIARALVHDPPLLLLDEPFSAVDALTRDQLVSDLQNVWLEKGDLTVLFITHHIEEAIFLGDRVLVMTPRPGRVAEILEINIPRPRRIMDRDDENHARYAHRIRDLFVSTGVFRDESTYGVASSGSSR